MKAGQCSPGLHSLLPWPPGGPHMEMRVNELRAPTCCRYLSGCVIVAGASVLCVRACSMPGQVQSLGWCAAHRVLPPLTGLSLVHRWCAPDSQCHTGDGNRAVW
jgi:hypothetical protein